MADNHHFAFLVAFRLLSERRNLFNTPEVRDHSLHLNHCLGLLLNLSIKKVEQSPGTVCQWEVGGQCFCADSVVFRSDRYAARVRIAARKSALEHARNVHRGKGCTYMFAGFSAI